MRKMYFAAPLPFVGQKRNFSRDFIKVLQQYPEDAVFIDLFGGSGLLAHIAKCVKPNATVVFNDYDNFCKRLRNIKRTNALIADLRKYAKDVPRRKPITGEARQRVFDRLTTEEQYGWVDYVTVSSSLLFSMKYQMNLDGMVGETLYNNVRLADYPEALDYLNGLVIKRCDYKELYEEYKNMANVVFLIDPPYLNTNVSTYRMSWALSDYLDVLTILRHHDFVYFTSNKSQILPLCEWFGDNQDVGNPFDKCKVVKFNERMNYNSTYEDIMLYTDSCIRVFERHS